MTGIIYCYKSPSGKYYVGQTKHEERRKKQHAHKNNKCYRFRKAIEKYGLENFEYEVLVRVNVEDRVKLKEVLNTLEKFYIKKFDSFKNGYNSTLGGECPWNEGKTGVYSEETKKKMSKASKGRAPWNKGKTGIYTDEARLNMSKNKKGQTPWNKGKTGIYSEDTRKRMSENGKGKLPSNAKKVDIFKVSGEFVATASSLIEAVKISTVCEPFVRKIMRGEKASCKGFVFKSHESSTTIEKQD
jgi:group I intron endonuclease